MTNLASLLNTKASDAKPPVQLPDGTYFGIVQGFEYITSKQKKTPGVEFTVQITHAHDDVDLSEFEAEGGKLTEKKFSRGGCTFYLSENSIFMLKNFIESCGIDTEDRSFGELIPQVVGQAVVLDIEKQPNQQGTGYFNNVKSMRGAASLENA